MKDIDELLRRHAPTPKRQLNKHFTKNVIAELIPEPRPSLGNRLQEFYMRFAHLPKYAAIGLAVIATGTLSTGAYAAFRWLNPEVTVKNVTESNDDHRREYTIDTQCGTLSSRSYRYELQQNSTLSNDEVYKIFKNTCEYNAVQEFASKTYRSDNTQEDVAQKKPGDTLSIYDSHNLFAGADDANKVFGLTNGRVTQISEKFITIESRIYQIDSVLRGPSFIAEGKVLSQQLPMLRDVQAWSEGKALPLSDVRIGDTVQLVKKTVHPLDDNKNLKSPTEFGVIGIIKTRIDSAYVYDSTLGNPAIVNQIAGLASCNNNNDYLCPSPLNQRLGEVYDTTRDGPHPENRKYRRTDIKDSSEAYKLSGRIQSISGNTVTLKTRGKVKTFTVELPYDAITAYNKDHKPPVGVGDLVEVYYAQKSHEDHLKIKPGDISVFAVIMTTAADGTLQNY